MSAAFLNPSTIVTGFLALGVVIALVRTAIRLRADHGSRTAAVLGWFAVLAALHVACATTLRYTLLPPATRISAETLEVRTGGVVAPASAPRANRVVLLPEAHDAAGAERVPDLASALRRYPDVRRIRVLGAGLRARDRDAAHSVVVEFQPSSLPVGLVEMHALARSVRGSDWTVHGRVEGVPGAVVQLVDPAGVVVASAKAGAAGRFALHTRPRAVGMAEFLLRIRHGARPLQPDITVPVTVTRADKLRVLIMAGAPGPDLKYLRRWARDAGLDVRTEISLGAVNRLTPASSSGRGERFQSADLVVLDERAWRGLGVAESRELLDAVRLGAGALLRITGPLSLADRSRLGLWGFDTEPTRAVKTSARQPRAAPVASVLTLRPPTPAVSSLDARSLSDPRDAAVLGIYRVEGRGRLGLWWASDSFRLVLGGEGAAHGRLWSRAFGDLARARSSRISPRLDQALMRVGERQWVCDVGQGARVRAPDGREFALLRRAVSGPVGNPGLVGSPSRTSGVPGCAAFWPRVPGWHEVRDNNAAWPFHVRSGEDSPGLFAHADREATLRLAARTAPAVRALGALHSQRRWPWFLAWLAATAMLWWLERASIPHSRR